MARIILGSYMVRYPLGGMMSWVLQYLVGFKQLGHDVYFVEKSGWRNACYDPITDCMTDNCLYGTKTVAALLARFGLDGRWCFVDQSGRYYGLPRDRIESIFKSADLFVDMGTHGTWLKEAAECRARVLVDGEPGFTQMKMEKRLASGHLLPSYDYYYSTGANIGTPLSTAPTAGRSWHHLFHPVVPDVFPHAPISEKMHFTTVMNWQSYEPVEYRGANLGHKDVEFRKFMALPSLTDARLEAAVSGKRIPKARLQEAGWRIRDAHQVTISFDSFVDYIRSSAAEFSVCKNGYVALNTGWFSDRSAVYLASARPVVLQDTGFGAHLPCGRGLFAVRTVDEAAAAIDSIVSHYEHHSKWAREIAAEYLDAGLVLSKFLAELES